MTPRRLHLSSSRAGYTLVEVLAASGLVAGAIAASSALSMSMARQEEFTRSQASATRYAEAIARIWQLGASPAAVLLNQPTAQADVPSDPDDTTAALSYHGMSFTISASTATSMGDDGGIAQGSVERATVTVTYLPFGSQTQASIVLDVLRPAVSHR